MWSSNIALHSDFNNIILYDVQQIYRYYVLTVKCYILLYINAILIA